MTELHGELAFRLCTAFGIVPIIPSPEKKTKPAKRNDWEGVDPQTMARAKMLGQIAMERAALPPPEADELEAQMQKTKVQSERKCRLFDSRD